MKAPARREAVVRTHAQPPTRPRLPSPVADPPACLLVCLCLPACLPVTLADTAKAAVPPSLYAATPPLPRLFSPSCASPPARSLPSPSVPPPSLAPLFLHHSIELDNGGSGRARSRCAARPCRQNAPTPAHFRARMHRGAALTGERRSKDTHNSTFLCFCVLCAVDGRAKGSRASPAKAGRRGAGCLAALRAKDTQTCMHADGQRRSHYACDERCARTHIFRARTMEGGSGLSVRLRAYSGACALVFGSGKRSPRGDWARMP